METVLQISTALADPVRLRSLALMAREGEICVCEVCHALQIMQPKASKHLTALREAGLVQARREAQWTFYCLADDLPGWARTMVGGAIEGMVEEAIHETDRQRLVSMPGWPHRAHSTT